MGRRRVQGRTGEEGALLTRENQSGRGKEGFYPFLGLYIGKGEA